MLYEKMWRRIVVARLESSSHMPSVATLKRVADATHSRLRIALEPEAARQL